MLRIDHHFRREYTGDRRLVRMRLIAKALLLLLLGVGLPSSVSAQADTRHVVVYNLSPAHERVKVVIDGMSWMNPHRFGKPGEQVSVDMNGRSSIPVEIRDILTDSLLAAETIDLLSMSTSVIFYGRYKLLSYYSTNLDEFTIVNTDTVTHYLTVVASTTTGDTIRQTIPRETVVPRIGLSESYTRGQYVTVRMEGPRSDWFAEPTGTMYILRTEHGARPFYLGFDSVIMFDSGAPPSPGAPKIRFANLSRDLLSLVAETAAFPGSPAVVASGWVSQAFTLEPGRYVADLLVHDTVYLDDHGFEATNSTTATHYLYDDPRPKRGHTMRTILTPNTFTRKEPAVAEGREFRLEWRYIPMIADTIGLEFFREGSSFLQSGATLRPDEFGRLGDSVESYVIDLSDRYGQLRQRFRLELEKGEQYGLFIREDLERQLSVYLLNLLHPDTASAIPMAEPVPLSSVGGSVQIVNLSQNVSAVRGVIGGMVPSGLDPVHSQMAGAVFYGEVGPDLSIGLQDMSGAILHDTTLRIEPKQRLVYLLYDHPSGSFGGAMVVQPHVLPEMIQRERVSLLNLEKDGREVDVIITARDTTIRFERNAFGTPTPYVFYYPVETTVTVRESATGRHLMSVPWAPQNHLTRTFVLRGSIDGGTLELVAFRTYDIDTALAVESVGSISAASDGMRLATSSVTPNPADDEVRVVLDVTGTVSGRLSLYDLKGQRRLVEEIALPTHGEHGVPLDVTSLSPGVYIVRFDADDGTRMELGSVTITR